jgi:hypothetical protein
MRQERVMEPVRTSDTEVTVTFSLPREEERSLLARARERGTDVGTFVRGLVEAELRRPPGLESILGPVHEEFRASGMSEEELGELIEEARNERWREKSYGTPTD